MMHLKYPLGKSGRDLFSCRKHITLVLVPFERFSVFPKAIDQLLRAIQIPFNLIVVEGNSPSSVRSAIESRCQFHPNIQIIYSHQYLTVPAALSLAVPHIKTPFALFLDNEIKLTEEAFLLMIARIESEPGSLVFPDVIYGAGLGDSWTRCFMTSHDALERITPFEDDITIGSDWALKHKALSGGLSLHHCKNAALSLDPDRTLCALDQEFYRHRWSAARAENSIQHLNAKWKLNLTKEIFSVILEEKHRLLRSTNPIPIRDVVTDLNAQLFVTRDVLADLFASLRKSNKKVPGTNNLSFSGR